MNTESFSPLIQMELHTENFNPSTEVELKAEMHRLGKLHPEELTLQERAAMLVGANQVLNHLEGLSKLILNPPAKDKDFYDIPLVALNQGVIANHLKGVKRFIAALGHKLGSVSAPLNKTFD
jgi:hypothetical protein